jgi:hypothetical protein
MKSESRDHLISALSCLRRVFEGVRMLPDLDVDYMSVLIFLLKSEDEAIVVLAMECLDRLICLSGPIESRVLETDLIERIVGFIQNGSNHLVLWTILANICGFAKSDGFEAVQRIFSLVSLEYLLMKWRSNSPPVLKETTFSKFLYNITRFEPSIENQVIILGFVEQSWQDGNERLYCPNAWTVMQMAEYDSFQIEIFYEKKLNLFADDLLFDSNPKCSWPALITIGRIYKRCKPPVDSRFDGIWALAFGEQACAALETMRYIVARSESFVLIFARDKQWGRIFDFFNTTSYSGKMACAHIINCIVIRSNERVLREMISDGLFGYLSEFFLLDSEQFGNRTMAVLRWILDVFEEAGAPGFLVPFIESQFDVTVVSQLVHCGNPKVARTAAILESRLIRFLGDKG